MKKYTSLLLATLLSVFAYSQSISNVTPNATNQGTWSLPVSISGNNTNFTSATSTVVKVKQGANQLEILSVNNVTSTTVDFDLRVSNLKPTGAYDVEVWDDVLGDMISLPGGFTVTSNATPPNLISTTPESGAKNQVLPVTITTENTHFSQATDNTIYLTQGTYTILPVSNSVQVLNDNHIKAYFDFGNSNISIGDLLSSHCGNSFDGYFSDNLSIEVTPITSINGTVIYAGTYNGVVELYQKNTNVSPNTYSLVASATVDASNNYEFNIAAEATYLLRSVPINMNDVVATYYPDVIDWVNATEITTNSSTATVADITPVSTTSLSGGTTVNGSLGYGPNGFTKAQVVMAEDVEIFLRNVDNNTYNQTSTDANGFYEFTQVPLGNYEIFIDLPGYTQTSTYTFAVNQSGELYENLDFLIDDQEIFKSGFLSSSTLEYEELEVYPNPTTGKVFIELPSYMKEVELKVFNQQGQVVFTKTSQNNNVLKYNIDLSHLENGLYIGRVFSGDSVIDFKVTKQ